MPNPPVGRDDQRGYTHRRGFAETDGTNARRGIPMRRWCAVLLNVIAPGAGLIVLRREWLGILLSACFAALSAIGLWGLLIVPLVVPAWFAVVSLTAAALLWVGSQGLLYHRWNEVCTRELDAALHDLRAQAEAAIARQELRAAYRALLVARSLNDEDAEVNARWAELMTLMDRPHDARRAWKRVLRLDHDHASPVRQRAIEALNSARE